MTDDKKWSDKTASDQLEDLKRLAQSTGCADRGVILSKSWLPYVRKLGLRYEVRGKYIEVWE
jgi:hypothetical protein